MQQIDHSNLPAGVSIERDYSSGVEYRGAEDALIVAGILHPDWLVGLGKHSRQIALLPEGGFVLVGEGKGNRLTFQHRQQGAFTVKRTPEGLVSVFKYRSKSEEEALDRARIDAYEQERERETWQRAKAVHGQTDLLRQWKEGVDYKIMTIEQLIDGEATFENFPEISIHPSDVDAAKKAIAELRNVLRWAEPRLRDKIVRSNVVSLNGRVYRNVGEVAA